MSAEHTVVVSDDAVILSREQAEVVMRAVSHESWRARIYYGRHMARKYRDAYRVIHEQVRAR